MYKYELHCHTAEVSRCAHTSAARAVELYRAAGYDGLVVTDHFSPMTFPLRMLFTPQKSTDFFFRGYREARKAAAGTDFTVLPGCELRFYATVNDYLLYGDVEHFLPAHGNLLARTPRSLSALTHAAGLLLVQAHPFRSFIHRVNPSLLDGIEVINGKDTTGRETRRALQWAKQTELTLTTGGSDFHREGGEARGGILTDRRISTNDDLLKVLRSGEYELVQPIYIDSSAHNRP